MATIIRLNKGENYKKGYIDLYGRTGRRYRSMALEIPGYGMVPCSMKLCNDFTSLSDNLMIVQTMLGHSDVMTTKIYINEIDKKQDKYNEDYSAHMIAKGNGIDTDISNSPIVALKSDDFRELLSKCFDMAQNGKDKFEVINELIGMSENLIV